MIGSQPSITPPTRYNISLLLTLTLFFVLLFDIQAQQIRFKKDIYPLLLNKQFEEAKPLLQELLTYEPQHTDATYWLAKTHEFLALKHLSAQEMHHATHLLRRTSSLFTKKDFGLFERTTIPEAKLFTSPDKVDAFKYFLLEKAGEMQAKAQQLQPKTIIDTFPHISDVYNRFGIHLPNELVTVSLNNFPISYQMIEYENRWKLDGLMQINVTSIPDLLQVNYQVEIQDNQLHEQHLLEIKHLRRLKKDLKFVPFEHISEFLNLDLTPYVNELNGYFNGYIHYITIDSNVYLDGSFSFDYQEEGVLSINGTLSQQQGCVDIINHEWPDYDQVGFRLMVENGEVTKIDFERLRYNQADYEKGHLTVKPTHFSHLNDSTTAIITAHPIITNEIKLLQLMEVKTDDATHPLSYFPTLVFSDSTQQEYTLCARQLHPDLKARLYHTHPINEWFQVEMEVRQILTSILPQREYIILKTIAID